MWILFGTTTRKRQVRGDNTFECPCCASPQPYWHLYLRRYFHVYHLLFVPYGHDDPLPLIQCGGCGTEFHEAVLRGEPIPGYSPALAPYENQQAAHDPKEDLASTSRCPKCGRENSVHSKVCPRCETRL